MRFKLKVVYCLRQLLATGMWVRSRFQSKTPPPFINRNQSFALRQTNEYRGADGPDLHMHEGHGHSPAIPGVIELAPTNQSRVVLYKNPLWSRWDRSPPSRRCARPRWKAENTEYTGVAIQPRPLPLSYRLPES
jgi:hypothetical protein